jgi:uncharacterized membrane protein
VNLDELSTLLKLLAKFYKENDNYILEHDSFDATIDYIETAHIDLYCKIKNISNK